MELTQLRGFATVARMGSFTRAAEVLFRSQPAMSLQVKALERELGEPLFERRGRTLLLTPPGRVLLERAEQILGLVEQADDEIAALKGLAGGTLVIGTNDSNCLYVLPALIQRFRSRFPAVELHLTNSHSAQVVKGVVEGRVGRGTFVRGLRPSGPGAASPIELQLSPAAERLLDYEHSRPQFAVPSDTIPLHSLVPDPSMFPVEAFRRAVNRAFADIGASLLAYGGPQGFAGLREVLAERLRGFGLTVGPDSLVLSSGASQGISLAMRLFAGSGDTVAIEAPTYHNALSTMIGLDLWRPRCRCARRDRTWMLSTGSSRVRR